MHALTSPVILSGSEMSSRSPPPCCLPRASYLARFFFLCSIILAFTMAAHYFILIVSAVPPQRPGSMAAPPPPLGRQIIRTDRAPRKLHKEREAVPAPRKLQMKPDTGSPRVTTLLAPPLRPPPPPPLHPHCPIFLHRWSRSPDVGASQEV